MFEKTNANNGCYSSDQEQSCQVIKPRTLWGNTTCRVWLSGKDAVARKIPDKILQEDPKLLMWYDQAVTRSEG